MHKSFVDVAPLATGHGPNGIPTLYPERCHIAFVMGVGLAAFLANAINLRVDSQRQCVCYNVPCPLSIPATPTCAYYSATLLTMEKVVDPCWFRWCISFASGCMGINLGFGDIGIACWCNDDILKVHIC